VNLRLKIISFSKIIDSISVIASNFLLLNEYDLNIALSGFTPEKQRQIKIEMAKQLLGMPVPKVIKALGIEENRICQSPLAKLFKGSEDKITLEKIAEAFNLFTEQAQKGVIITFAETFVCFSQGHHVQLVLDVFSELDKTVGAEIKQGINHCFGQLMSKESIESLKTKFTGEAIANNSKVFGYLMAIDSLRANNTYLMKTYWDYFEFQANTTNDSSELGKFSKEIYTAAVEAVEVILKNWVGKIDKQLVSIQKPVASQENADRKQPNTQRNNSIRRSQLGLIGIAGLEALKKELYEKIIDPVRHPEQYEKFLVSPINGLLLVGPNGCGKTLVAQKTAEELGYNFIEMSPAKVGSSYIHGTVKLLEDTYQKAKDSAPSILFIDEAGDRYSQSKNENDTARAEEISQLLLVLNNAGHDGVLVIMATNRPDNLDSRLIRSGRIDLKIEVPLPDFKARVELFQIYLEGRPFSSNLDFAKLAELTEEYTGSDIELIVNNAARQAAKFGKEEIDLELLIKCISEVPSSNIAYRKQFQNETQPWKQ